MQPKKKTFNGSNPILYITKLYFINSDVVIKLNNANRPSLTMVKAISNLWTFPKTVKSVKGNKEGSDSDGGGRVVGGGQETWNQYKST